VNPADNDKWRAAAMFRNWHNHYAPPANNGASPLPHEEPRVMPIQIYLRQEARALATMARILAMKVAEFGGLVLHLTDEHPRDTTDREREPGPEGRCAHQPKPPPEEEGPPQAPPLGWPGGSGL
jgi:hypothetical protein